MINEPSGEVTLGYFLQEILRRDEIDVIVVPTAQNEVNACVEHLKLTPPKRIDLSRLREIVSHYYGADQYTVITTEIDGRHFRMECGLGPLEYVVNCTFNFQGEECIEIIVT